MKRLIALVTGALVVAGLTVVPAQTASAGSTTVYGFPYGASVTLNFTNLTWSDPTRCLSATVTGSFNGQLTGDWGFWADIQSASNPASSSYAGYWSEDSGNFVARDAFQLCPKDHPNGLYSVKGYVGVSADPSGIWAWVEVPFATEFTLSPMATTTTLAVPTVVGSLTTFSGRVLATSPNPNVGQIAPDPAGQVAIETFTGQTWTRIGLGNPDASGFFALPVGTVLPPGSRYQAHFLGTTTCAESFSAVQVVPTPPVVQPAPTVKVKAVSGRSKLKVDVNPNMGRKYWTFQVQRKVDGTWKALKTYRTIGSTEKRTINLPKGTYQVFVNPKFGYQGALSAEIRLKR